MKLADTVELMLSENNEERLIAEYLQLESRKNSLWKFLKLAESGKVKDLNPELFKSGKKQHYFMTQYSKLLKERAKLMKVDLNGWKNRKEHAGMQKAEVER